MVNLNKVKRFGRKIQLSIIAVLLVLTALPISGINLRNALAAGPAPGTPGGIPDYWTTPNYANSPLPEFNPETSEIVPGSGIRKFVDTLPGLGKANENNLHQYIPVAIPDTTTYPGSDYYEISLVQYSQKMHSDLPETLLRGYMQTNTEDTTVKNIPSKFGPTIVAQKNRPVRIKFTNALPTGKDGDLFLPVDTTIMGSGMGPDGKNMYTQNRATLHLHGGVTPWISDGTPHQWITPAGEKTPYPKGVSVKNVPDMPDPGDGSMTFFYTNQQSARLMFYHDHSYGLTRLNVYAGESAGYLLQDDVEKDLIDRGIIPKDEIPLLIEDKTFVPSENQLAATDPTWDKTKWGGMGNLWFPHVYMPNQNPFDLTGANEMGRWDYGPWFWPPNTGLLQGPVKNPLAGQEGQAPENPGTPNVSWVPESFMDTPVINGTAYPTLTVEPKSYRFRILNASNDRNWNLQLYKAASNAQMWNDNGTLNDANAGEVPMVDAVKKAGYPAKWPRDGRDGGVPDPSAAGPKMVQIGTESGFLKDPAVLDNQPINYEYGRLSITVLNVSDKTLFLAPAERADVIVDFSQYAGETLILYNDAPAPVPAFDPRYDYYTGDPDFSATGDNSGGAPTTQPGYGPNTRTIMQIKIADSTPAPAYDLNTLKTELPKAFAAGQNPLPSTDPKTYGTIQANNISILPPNAASKVTVPMLPKAIAEEFEVEYGRMNAVLGTELPNTNFQNQTTIMLGYVDPSTENLTDAMTPLTPPSANGTQIWKVTHNGVDTHAIHFHLFDVQLINRVGWDGSIRFPDANERGWKDTVRMNPLEDTIIALRPVAPKLPFGIPDSIRLLDPTIPLGSTGMFMNVDPLTGNPVTTRNVMTNFGWEYVWHCHLLGHEENDMMRPIKFTVKTVKPKASVLSLIRANDGSVSLTWTAPTPINYLDWRTFGDPAKEVGFNIMRAPVDSKGKVGTFVKIAVGLANSTAFTDKTADPNTSYQYRVDSFNAATNPNSTNPITALDGGTPSNTVTASALPKAPSSLTVTSSGQNGAKLTWTNNAANTTGFVVERSADGITYTVIARPTQTSYTDSNLSAGTYTYRVKAVSGTTESGYSNTASITIAPPAPAAPSNLAASLLSGTSVILTWRDNATNATGFTVERSTDNKNFTVINSPDKGAVTYIDSTVQLGMTYFYRVNALNGITPSGYSNTVSIQIPNVPTAPTKLKLKETKGTTTNSITVSWTEPTGPITNYEIQYSTDSAFKNNVSTKTVSAPNSSVTIDGFAKNTTYYIRIRAINQLGASAWVADNLTTSK
ncbi:fibronectin type III domain-containing protein [Neobacillus sp. NPDC093127]|uniref:fibronectin type III domain-containing protein n=1 Tax=Neobacillus sp. NPDC093127 TaxID=3364296 RepID=UPI0037F1CFD0